MASKQKDYPCACEYQIVWHFGKPTICACPDCERTYHYTVETCPVCGHVTCEFELTDESYTDFYAPEAEE